MLLAVAAATIVAAGAQCGGGSGADPAPGGGSGGDADGGATDDGQRAGSEGGGGSFDSGPPPNDGAVTVASSVTEFGITWTFDAPHTIGQFANGDPWVVGPVTITAVSPAPANGRNGSVVDPTTASGQAYDARGDDYDATPLAAFPLTLSGTHSIVSSASHDASDCTLGGGAPGYSTYDGDCQGGPVATQAVLTVVDAPVAAGTFRPPYVGGAPKTMHPWSSVNIALLPRLPKPASAPSDAEALRHVERPWIDHMTTWTLQYACATENMYCYGREIGHVVSEVADYVLLDTPAQKALAVRFI